MGQITEEARKAMNIMTTASMTLREAISRSLPVANTQLLTVSIPGTVVNYNDYYYDQKASPFTPLQVRVNEARLVDGMLPLSKISMGKSGKSVARSYSSALDLLIPVEASVSGLIADPSNTPPEGRRKIIKDRYDNAMTYLNSYETDDSGKSLAKSKLTKYVEKQELWHKAVEGYAIAQERQQGIYATQFESSPNKVKQQQEAFLQWLQAHARDYMAAIQARYMDWVVHGYKFKVEFNFGIVDISSGMKRVESSKEALRNLVIISEDGFTEYNQVHLEPSDWATKVRNKVLYWNKQHAEPTPAEIRAEIKRLRNLLISHNALKKSVDDGSFHAVMPADNPADKSLQDAYVKAYGEIEASAKVVRTGGVLPKTQYDAKGKPIGAFGDLLSAQNEWKESSLNLNKKEVQSAAAAESKEVSSYLQMRITFMEQEIRDLEAKLPTTKAFIPEVLDENGIPIAADDLKKDPDLLKPPTMESTPADEPSAWTKISAKVSSSQSESVKLSSESASSFAIKAGWGLWSASAGASHTQASSSAMSSMANLDVEVSMECMVVNIERPWLHGELFSDSDLDVGQGFKLSPGATELLTTIDKNEVPDADYQQFSSYPTAFVIAANVELNFNGNTASLQSSLEASSTQANINVGWGPFAVSASHKQSKTKAATKTETTATGMKISLQAPQIIGWVQTLLPKLPRDPAGKSKMEGVGIAPPPAQAPLKALTQGQVPGSVNGTT